MSIGGGTSAEGDMMGNTDPFVSSQGGGGLNALLQDPELMKAIGGVMSSAGAFSGSIKKLPPQVQKMLAQAMSKGGIGAPAQATGGGPLNPYGGNMTEFIPPSVAMATMDRMGIPYH